MCCMYIRMTAFGEKLDGSRMKVYIYDLPPRFNHDAVYRDVRCLSSMFALEIHMHLFLLSSSSIRTLDPDKADWFYTPVYTNCELTDTGLPLIDNMTDTMINAIHYIASHWPYWNRTDGADHFFVVPHDFGACFHFQVRNFPLGASSIMLSLVIINNVAIIIRSNNRSNRRHYIRRKKLSSTAFFLYCGKRPSCKRSGRLGILALRMAPS